MKVLLLFASFLSSIVGAMNSGSSISSSGTSAPGNAPIEKIPLEITQQILSYLDDSSVNSLGTASRGMADGTRDERRDRARRTACLVGCVNSIGLRREFGGSYVYGHFPQCDGRNMPRTNYVNHLKKNGGLTFHDASRVNGCVNLCCHH